MRFGIVNFWHCRVAGKTTQKESKKIRKRVGNKRERKAAAGKTPEKESKKQEKGEGEKQKKGCE